MLAVILKNDLRVVILLLTFFSKNLLNKGIFAQKDHCWEQCLCYDYNIHCVLADIDHVPTNISYETKTL